jgi:hypothetical protein
MGRRRLRFLKSARSVLLSLRAKTSDRIIADCTMVSPLANDKGTVISNNKNNQKHSLVRSKTSSYNRTGNRNK